MQDPDTVSQNRNPVNEIQLEKEKKKKNNNHTKKKTKISEAKMGGILENQKREIEEIRETLKKCPGKQRNHKID